MRNTFIVATFCCCFWVGCSKAPISNQTSKTNTINKLTIKIVSGGITSIQRMEFFYDSIGRMVKQNLFDSSKQTASYDFIFSDSKIIQNLTVFIPSTTFKRDTFFLNADGRAYKKSNGESYEYNALGNMIKQTIPLGIDNVIINYNFIDGNMMSQSTSSPQYSYFHEYTYYPDKTPIGKTGIYYLGVPSKNLVKSATVTISGASSSTNFTYTFDSKNRISSASSVATGASDIVSTTTYEYND